LGAVRVYRYNAQGDLVGEEQEVKIGANEKLTVTVPPGGLAIAEVTDPQSKECVSAHKLCGRQEGD
jgi:hypothetical protein